MATKFSDFTAQAATSTAFVVGYDGTTNTQYSQTQLTDFVLGGTLGQSNTLTLGGYQINLSQGGSGNFLYMNGTSANAYFLQGRYNGQAKASLGLNTGSGRLELWHGGTTKYIDLNPQGYVNYLLANTSIGANTGTPPAKLHVKGQGTTSATTAFLVERANGNDIFRIDDDRSIALLGSSTFYNVVTIDNAGVSDASAILTVNSTTQGMLPPRMTTAQRDAINSGTFTTGLTLYNTTTNKLQFYNGTAWQDAAGGDNIYTADGTINEDRIVTIANNGNVPYSVNFKGNSGAAGAGPVFLQIENERVDAAYSTNSGAQLRLKGGSSSGSLNTDLDIIAHGSDYGGSSAPQVHFNSNRGYTFTAGTSGSTTSYGVSQDLVLKSGDTGRIVISTTTNFSNNTNTTIAMVGGGGTSSSMIQMGKFGDGIGKFFRASANGVLQIGKHSGGAYGSAGTTTTEIYVDGNSNVGIGDNTTINARLHVTGSGATSSTTSFLVENSSGDDILNVRDDQYVTITGNNAINNFFALKNDATWTMLDAGDAGSNNGQLRIKSSNNNRFWFKADAGLVIADSGAVALDSSAVLKANSTTKGLLPPRMTNTQRDAISSPTAGLMLYSSTDSKLQFYNGSAWTDAGGGGDSIYTADGNIVATRTINDRTGGFTGTAGNHALKMNVRNSGALIVAGYQNNGDPGTVNNCFRWGPGATNGSMNVRGNLALSSGGGAISLIASNGTQYATINQASVSFNTTGNQEYIAPAIGFGTSASTNYRVRIKGATSTSSGYGLQVQNSSNDQMLSIRDDGVFTLGKAAATHGTTSVAVGNNSTATAEYSTIVGNYARVGNSAYSYSTVFGYNSSTAGNQAIVLGANSGAAQDSIAIGYSSNSASADSINIGKDSEGNATNSITLNVSGGVAAPSTAKAFGVYMSDAATPDFRILHDGNSYITGTGNFGVGITSPTDRIQTKTSIGIIGDGSNAGTLKLYCQAGTAHHVAIEGPEHSGGSTYTIKLPNTAPSAGQVLVSDANGNLSWKSPHELDFSNLPTSDPSVEGRLYNDEGTIKVSIP